MQNLFEEFTLIITALTDHSNKNKVFTRLWQIYYKRVLFFVTTHFSVNEAEDLTQEIMIKVYNNLASYHMGASLKTWIYTIARNHCIDYTRKKHPEQMSVEYELPAHMEEVPESRICFNEIESRINRVIKTCLPVEQDIFYLFFYEHFKIREIAAIVNLPGGTVKFKIYKIRELLQKELEEFYEK